MRSLSYDFLVIPRASEVDLATAAVCSFITDSITFKKNYFIEFCEINNIVLISAILAEKWLNYTHVHSLSYSFPSWFITGY